ncbi:MAG: uracil-DNA glycosylase [Bacteroidota bacterium]|nr:uracil-DNA glycosylase [Candidatus Kapabacteria bacterium]MCX7936307.1 uracil-DNA glycosylase [Chlorobiota bacterium]MDW8074411.1 uracil-DNA glycosylase [Bacteroidota bacterium]
MRAPLNKSPLSKAIALLQHLQAISGGYVLAKRNNQHQPSKETLVRDYPALAKDDVPIIPLSSSSNTPSMPEVIKVERSRQKSFTLQIPLVYEPVGMFDAAPDFMQAQTLEELYNRIHTCTKCPLGSTRTNFVFGAGNPHAEIVFIGEAPGADEDLQGEPFVGRAGQLLTKILASINLSREEVYICNILKCRPPNNRKPLPSEVEQCQPYLYMQLKLINPPFIVALGLTAAETLLRRKLRMAEARGRWYDFYGARMLVTYHPAALLRNPELKRDTWDDVRMLRKAYDEYRQSGRLPEPTVS